jgi:hypothetical protein
VTFAFESDAIASSRKDGKKQSAERRAGFKVDWREALLNGHAFWHILLKVFGYARLTGQNDRSQGHGSLPAEIRHL